MRQLVADYEIALVSHGNMSADPDTFREVHEELQVSIIQYGVVF
jgi:hypothetical protein